MLQNLLLLAVVLTSGTIAIPHPLPQQQSPSPPWTNNGWQTWAASTSTLASSPASTPTATVSASSVSSAPPNPPPITSTSSAGSLSASPGSPCASVSELAASFLSLSPSATATVPAELAYSCLNSVPFNQSAAVKFLDSIDPYLNWQTTFEYLKDPPAEYAEKVQQPYDFFATWDAIKANTSAGAYQNQYEFGWTVYRAAQLAHDGHFVFYTDSVTSIFSFARPLPLVSISLDGVSEPQPYLHSDIVAAYNGSAEFTPSPITEINGEDAIQFLLVWSQYGSLQDPDALWNNLFWEPAQVALGTQGTGTGTFSGGGRGRWPYPGPTTTLKFANGTELFAPNYANVLMDFTNITSGEDLYETYFAVPPEAYENLFSVAASEASSISALASATASETAALTTAAASSTLAASSTYAAATSSGSSTTYPAPGYPTPFVSEFENTNAGYFIDAPGYEDVAVLVVRTFVGDGIDEIPFQDVNTYFIETAAKMGKTKLIIDLSANGGGTILQGYDLFKQLFPSILPYGGSRYRAHEAFNLLGEQGSYLASQVPRSLDDNTTFIDILSSVFDYQEYLNEDYEPFNSWSELYGPHPLGPEPDNFTSIIRWNLSDIFTTYNSGGINITGYEDRTNITQQPFAAENIILLTDGYCASTCTIFSELMINQGGVRTVALGGRPQPGIIQAIGGVKGTNDNPFEIVAEYISEIWEASNSTLQESWMDTVLADYTLLPIYSSTTMVLNVRNGYLPGEDTPLQFVYEPADCRILYTPQMIVDETAVWKTVADSVWGGGNGDACVAGGFGAANGSKQHEVHRARDGVDTRAMLESYSVRSENRWKRPGESFMMV